MHKFWRVVVGIGLPALLLVFSQAAHADRALALPLTQSADQGEQIFKSKCVSCHTIGGGKLVGPDLQGVTTRRDRAWLEQFIQDPNALFQAGDPDAKALLDEYQIPMPALGLSAAEVQAVINYLETTASASAQPTAETENGGGDSSEPPPAVPATHEGTPSQGEKMFLGETPFENGGVGCVACHSVAGIGPLGGGTMGPDLTHVASRYGEQGLASVLQALPFPVMQEIYADKPLTPAEQAHLLAFLMQADRQEANPANTGLSFVASGLLGAGFLFVLLAFGWPRQRESISAKLRRKA